MKLGKALNSVLQRFGYRVQRTAGGGSLGIDPFRDMRRLIVRRDSPTVFDVGANVGQSVANFRKNFDRPVIHSFEPSPHAFAELRAATVGVPDLSLNNIALGSRPGEMRFYESAAGTPMSSLLEPGSECWGGGEVKEILPVRVSTIDAYCSAHHVRRIDILKIDTQGFDFEVIKGAEEMLRAHAIQMIHMEIIFCDMYKGLPRMDQIYGFLADRGFDLVSFYPFYYWANKASWTEGLFLDPKYQV